MNIVLSHVRNPLMNWDVTVTATGEGKERIMLVRTDIRNSPQMPESVSPPAKNWSRTYRRVGEYPGDNKVTVTVTDDQANDTTAVDEWSS